MKKCYCTKNGTCKPCFDLTMAGYNNGYKDAMLDVKKYFLGKKQYPRFNDWKYKIQEWEHKKYPEYEKCGCAPELHLYCEEHYL